VRGDQITQYYLHYSFSLLQHIIIPEPHNAIPLGFKICRSLRIRNELLCVLATIKFDD